MTTPSTKSFVEVSDIRDSVVLLKDGSLRSVVEVESINFELKSNDEQVAVLRGFQDFLNSIDFPLQIIINSRRLDIKPYLTELATLEGGLSNELLKVQLGEYTRFITMLSELAHIMTKRFFLVIPYYQIEAPGVAAAGVKDRLKGFFGGSKRVDGLSDELVKQYQGYLEQRISVILSGLSPLGIEGKVLGHDELIAIYKDYYGNTV